MGDDLMTQDEAADLLRVSPSTLKRWRLSGSGPACIRLSARQIRYRRADLEDWIASLQHCGATLDACDR